METEASDQPWARGENLSKRQHEAWQVMLREQARLGRSITSAELAKALGITIHGAHYLKSEVARLGYARRVHEAGMTRRGAARLAVEERLSRAEVMREDAAQPRSKPKRPDVVHHDPARWIGEHSLDLKGAQVAAVVNAFAEWRRIHDPYATDGEALAGIVGEWSTKHGGVCLMAHKEMAG